MSPRPAPSAAPQDASAVAPRREPSGLARAIAAEMGADRGEPLRAAALARRSDAPVRDVLLAHGIGTPGAVLAMEARRWGTAVVDLGAKPPDPRLVAAHDPAALLRAGCVPGRRVGGATVWACARPEGLARFLEALGARPGHMVVASEAQVAASVERLAGARLVRRAEALPEARLSARTISTDRSAPLLGATLGGLVLWGLLHAASLLMVLSVWAVVTLVMTTTLRGLAAAVHLRPRPPEPAEPEVARLPVVSMLVPLLREEAIAGRLLRRLRRVDYPRELLDVVLVVEAEDRVTRRALARLDLPPFMRVVTVPPGSVRTKPRALNYALPHCRGSIVGIWDAEDMPAPGQIRQVARRFAARGPRVACLQGRLDYYNARHNAIARLFTVEYAAWFRVFLPGIERLGLPVPLGGTTLFLRREAIEAVGGWDAHNVTEDADLGLRLARRGYRTEVVDTTTLEEANSRPWPWIKQRSRWLKGYALTWAVHMREPRALWRDLGPRGFLGVQAVFLATVSQFAMAPLLWLFLAVPFGMPHPLAEALPPAGLAAMTALFVAAQVLDLGVAALAVRGPRHRHLVWCVPLLVPYYWMATIAMWKALWEIATSPFYWDKTEHGAYGEAVTPPPDEPAPPP